MNRSDDLPWIDSDSGSGPLLAEAVSYASTNNKQGLARFQAVISNYGWIPTSIKVELICYSMVVDLLYSELDSVGEVSRTFRTEMLLENSSPNISLWELDNDEKYPHKTNLRLTINLDLITIDTIHLCLPVRSLHIAPNHQLEIHNYPGRDRILWRDEQGDVTTGSQAIWRGNGIYLEIKKLKRGFIDGDPVGCIIQLSIPGVYGHGDNLMALDYRVTKDVFDTVEQKLREIGVSADLKAAKITRCDLNRSIALDEPFKNYSSVWKLLNFPRTDKVVYNQTGVMCLNKSQTIELYDKVALMKKRGFDVEGLPPIARLEWRIKGAANVREKLGVNSLKDLLNHWGELPDLYRKCKNSLFSHDLEALQIPKPRNDRNQQSPPHKEIQNLVRWCHKNQIEVETEERLQTLLSAGGIQAYSTVIKAIPSMDQKHAGTSIRRMRTALVREAVLTDVDFIRRYKELQYKFEGKYMMVLTKAS